MTAANFEDHLANRVRKLLDENAQPPAAFGIPPLVAELFDLVDAAEAAASPHDRRASMLALADWAYATGWRAGVRAAVNVADRNEEPGSYIIRE